MDSENYLLFGGMIYFTAPIALINAAGISIFSCCDVKSVVAMTNIILRQRTNIVSLHQHQQFLWKQTACYFVPVHHQLAAFIEQFKETYTAIPRGKEQCGRKRTTSTGNNVFLVRLRKTGLDKTSHNSMKPFFSIVIRSVLVLSLSFSIGQSKSSLPLRKAFSDNN